MTKIYSFNGSILNESVIKFKLGKSQIGKSKRSKKKTKAKEIHRQRKYYCYLHFDILLNYSHTESFICYLAGEDVFV